MLFMLGETDLSKYIVEGTYKIDSQREYEEWKDANYRNRRKYVKKRVVGSFDIVCSNVIGFTTRDFLNLINENVTNNELYCDIYANNDARVYSIYANYNIVTQKHTPTADIFTVEIAER